VLQPPLCAAAACVGVAACANGDAGCDGGGLAIKKKVSNLIWYCIQNCALEAVTRRMSNVAGEHSALVGSQRELPW